MKILLIQLCIFASFCVQTVRRSTTESCKFALWHVKVTMVIGNCNFVNDAVTQKVRKPQHPVALSSNGINIYIFFCISPNPLCLKIIYGLWI